PAEAVDLGARAGLFRDVDAIADRYVCRIAAASEPGRIGAVKMPDVPEQFTGGRVALHAVLARVGRVDDAVRVHAEGHDAVRDQQPIQRVVPADVVAELAGGVKAADRAARRVPRPHVAAHEADGRDTPPPPGAPPRAGDG